jgi:hypothetical protein
MAVAVGAESSHGCHRMVPPAAVGAGGGVAEDDVGCAGDAGGVGVHGLEGDKPGWGSGSSSCCAGSGVATAVHCTVAATPPLGL